MRKGGGKGVLKDKLTAHSGAPAPHHASTLLTESARARRPRIWGRSIFVLFGD